MAAYKSLRIRVLALLMGTLLIVLAVAIYRTYERRTADSAYALGRLQAETDLIAQRQSEVLRNAEELATFLTSGRDAVALADNSGCGETLARFLERRPALNNIAIAMADGNVACIARGKRTSISDRDYFRKALVAPGTIIGDPVVSRTNNNWVLPLAQPIRDRPGTPQAVLVVTLDLAWVARELELSKHTKDNRLGLVNSGGVVLAHYPDAARMVGQNIAGTSFFKTMVAQAGRGTGEEAGLDGAPRIFAFSRFAETPAGPIYLWVSQYKRAVTAAADRQFHVAIAVWLVLALLAVGVVWFASRRYFLRPLSAISQAARRLSAGDFQARTGISEGDGELGELAGIFDRMAIALASKAELLRLNRALRVLSTGGNALVRAESEKELLAETCRVIVEVGGYRMAWIGFAQHGRDQAVRSAAQHSAGAPSDAAHHEITWGEHETAQGSVGLAIRTCRTQTDGDIAASAGTPAWRDAALARGYRSRVVLPLADRRNVFGVLNIYAAEPDAFAADEIGLLEELAANLAFGIVTQRSRIEQQRAEQKAVRLQKFDVLTDLPNRVELIEQLNATLVRARSDEARIAVLVIAIDHLVNIQDAVGIVGADEILKQFAMRLVTSIGNVHFIARIGGDSFAAIVPSAIEDAAAVARTVSALTEEPFEYAGIPIEVQLTAGAALFPDHGADPDMLLRRADIAVRAARTSASPYAAYTGRGEGESTEHLVLLADLRRAIRSDGLTLCYQPKVTISSPISVSGAEALVRWEHASRGAVPPNVFIPLAERTGLMKPLTYSVISMALRQASEWARAGRPTRIAVNVSPNNVRDPEFLEQLASMPRRFGVTLAHLDLEIAEIALLEDPERSRDLLRRISELGVRIFIANFGTGRSSLAYLATLPLYALKIDRSFVVRLNEPRFRAVVSSATSLAGALGLKVVGEGVETQQQQDALVALGCSEIQGYLYTEPLAAEAFRQWCDSLGVTADAEQHA
jgi:diguanylate cyclase